MKTLIQVALGFACGAAAASAVFVYLQKEAGWSANDSSPRTPPLAASPQVPPTVPPTAPAGPDLAASSLQAQRERAAGRYVLDSEIPWLRERLSKNEEAALTAIMKLVGPDYELLFDRLGIQPPLREQLLHHLSLIYKEKRQIRILQSSLATAQSEFLSRVKAAVTPEKYTELRAFEEFDRARRESAQLIEFARSRGADSISAERIAEFQEVVHAAQAYSPRTLGEWGSALHEPAAAVGGERAEAYLVSGLSAFTANREVLFSLARERGFSAQELTLLNDYYARQETYFTNGLRDLKDPIGAQVRLLEGQISRMKADPSVDRRAIQRLEQSLSLLKRNQPGGS